MSKKFLGFLALAMVGMMARMDTAVGSSVGSEVPLQYSFTVCEGICQRGDNGQPIPGEGSSIVTQKGSINRDGSLDVPETGFLVQLPGGDSVLITPGGNIDPVQTLGIVVNDLNAPGTFVVSTDVVLSPALVGLITAKSSLQGGCTDGNADPADPADPGCGATPFLTPGNIAQFFVNSFADDLGIPRGGSPGTGLFVGASGTFPPLNPGAFSSLSTTFDCGPLPGCTSFQSVISFTGSGHGDQISFTSRLELTPQAVPEPSTLSLLGLGLLGLGGAIWRRRS